MPKHTHDFVETYDGFVGFGFDRPTAMSETVVRHKQTGKPTGMVLLGYPGTSVRQPEDDAADPRVRYGASPRGLQALLRAARVQARVSSGGSCMQRRIRLSVTNRRTR